MDNVLNIRIFDRPALVVIDAHALTYARFIGAKHTVTCRSLRPLEAWEVEFYRVDPAKYLGSEVE